MASKSFFLRVLLLLALATAALVGTAWAADPVLDLGTGSGSVGTKVTIPLTLTTNGASVASVAIDIGYNTQLLGTPTATLNSAVNSADPDNPFSIIKSTPRAGVYRIAIFNSNAPLLLGSGVVANVSFTVVGAGSATLTNTPSASDLDTNPFTVTGAAGAITGIGLSQTISFGAAPTLTYLGKGTVTASATSGLGVTLTSANENVCTIAGTEVTAKAAGQICTIYANQGGDLSYNAAAQVRLDIPIGKATQSIGLSTSASTLTYGGPTGTVTATATSGLPVTLASNADVCTVSENVVTANGAGNCVIVASQTGNDNYEAATAQSLTIVIGRANQTVTLTTPSLTYGGVGTLSASSTSGLTDFTYSTTTGDVCTIINNNQVRAEKAGLCTVTATQAGNVNYADATATRSFTVGQATQTIAFELPAPELKFGGTAVVKATATSGLSVTYSSNSVCNVNAAGVVSPVTVGTCIVAANQEGDTNFQPALERTLEIVIGKADQTITVAPLSLTFGGEGTISATSSAPLTAFTFALAPESGANCSVEGTRVRALAAGTCTVIVSQAGDASYSNAQATLTIPIAKAAQSITFDEPAPSLTFGGASRKVRASATSGATDIVFTSKTPAICSIENVDEVTPVAAGECIVAANLAESANYTKAAEVTQKINVAQATQTITFNAPVTMAFSDSVTLSAESRSGLNPTGLTVTLAAAPQSACTVGANGLIIPVSAGTCTVTATQAGNTNYAAADAVTRTITITAVAPGVPTAVSAIPANGEARVYFGAPASNGGSAVTGYTVTVQPGDIVVTGEASPIQISNLVNGTAYTFTVSATNAAGTGTASAATTPVTPNELTVAIGVPSATLVKGGSSVSFTVTYASAASITLGSGDVALLSETVRGEISVSVIDNATRTVTISNLTGDGIATIKINAGTATDVSGQIVAPESAPSATFTVDSTVPANAITMLADNSITGKNSVDIRGTVSDANGVASLAINGTPVTFDTAGAYSTAVALQEGANTITVVAADLAGNQASVVRTITFDRTAPEISNLLPASGSIVASDSAVVSGNLSKRGTVTVKVNGGNLTPAVMNEAGTGFTLPVTLNLGSNTIDLWATNTITADDGSSTTTSESAYQLSLTVDNTVPELKINDPAQTITTVLRTIPVSGTVSADVTANTFTFAVDGVAVTPAPAVVDGKFSTEVTFNEAKTYKITVSATDQANHTGTAERNIVYQPATIGHALRALRIAVGLDTATVDERTSLDIGPLQNGKPAADGQIDIADAVVLLNYVVGNY